MSDQSAHDRQYYRAAARLAIRYGPDTPEGRRAMAMDENLWQTQSRLEEAARSVKENRNVDEALLPLLDVLRWMDFKIDLILHHMRQREFDLHFPNQIETSDISGSGLGFLSPGKLEVGQAIIVAISLPSLPWRQVYACGEVVRAHDKPGQEPLYGVKFTQISDADRERLIRFTFEQQRRELAKRSQEASV